EAIVDQVRQCPSGALSVFRNDAADDAPGQPPEITIDVRQDGPLLVHGRVNVRTADGTVTLAAEPTALGRCGGSANKPYCDGTHGRNGFRG
ncbi:MAG: CDGSH iron-sulfur domain-containing protein, partial [Frankiaceae bacterium]